MPNFKVLVDFEHEGEVQTAGSEIELTEEQAAEYLSDGRVERLEEAPADDTEGGEDTASDEEEGDDDSDDADDEGEDDEAGE